MSRVTVTLTEKEELAEKLFRVRFDLPAGETLQFQAGQFMSIAVDGFIRRSYSMANSPVADNFLETFVDTVPGGPGSKFFDECIEGQEVDLLVPLGRFVYLPNSTDVHFFATGTGATPFFSMLSYELETLASGRQIWLHYGVREANQLLMHTELQSLEAKYANFHYHPFLSKPHPDWSGKVGRITQHLSEVVDPNADVYICGGKEMIIDIEQGLVTQEHNPERIYYERFY